MIFFLDRCDLTESQSLCAQLGARCQNLQTVAAMAYGGRLGKVT